MKESIYDDVFFFCKPVNLLKTSCDLLLVPFQKLWSRFFSEYVCKWRLLSSHTYLLNENLKNIKNNNYELSIKIVENVQLKFLKRFNISYTTKTVYSQWIRFSEIPRALKTMETSVPNEILFKVYKYWRSIGD